MLARGTVITVMIYKTSSRLLTLAAFVIGLVAAGDCQAQASGRNNPYSPSPVRKTGEQPSSAQKPAPQQIAFVVQDGRTTAGRPQNDIARPTENKNVEVRTLAPTETYKVGVGDILLVSLKNSPRGEGYYTVRSDGTIDYPLAGDNVVVANQTPDGIRGMLASRITLFRDPDIEVKVREYGSHRINVSGLVERSGEKKLQREAVPLFVIKADAGVGVKATKVVITRGPMLKPEMYNLRDPNTDNVLVYPGNSVEFAADAVTGSYFISGEVRSGGQKELSAGLTLYQAIAASRGTIGNPKKVKVRRKNDRGAFSVLEFKLQSIKDGKISDPPVLSGDVIEISN